jgi:hypothetical protein
VSEDAREVLMSSTLCSQALRPSGILSLTACRMKRSTSPSGRTIWTESRGRSLDLTGVNTGATD